MASTITLTFNSIPAVDTKLFFATNTGTQSLNLQEVFKTARVISGQSIIGTSIDDTMSSYKSALELDYNNTNLYTINVNYTNKTVVITLNNTAFSFIEVSNTTNGAVTSVIVNDVITPFEILSAVVSQADNNPCNNYKLTITTSTQATSLSSPQEIPVTTNPIVVELPRISAEQFIKVKKGSIEVTHSLIRVPKLISAYLQIQQIQTPSGTSVSMNRLYPLSNLGGGSSLPLTFEYSLNNVDWQSSNQWSGLQAGNYTMSIRDNIGCTSGLSFVVQAFTPNAVDFPSICEISNVNSIRFKKNQTFANCGIRPIVSNTLSYEENHGLTHRSYKQLFQKCDKIKTQIKTNHSTVTAKIKDCQGNETILTPTKVTDFMNKTDIRDGYVFRLIDGFDSPDYMAVRYEAGNTYDPVNQIQNGTYNIGKNVPSFVNAGDYLFVDGLGWQLVNEIKTISLVSGTWQVAVLNIFHTDLPAGFVTSTTRKITSVYNIQNYERWQFDIDFSTFQGDYQVFVNTTHATFDNCEHISEWLDVQERHECTHVIDYYNTTNNEINYNFGIRHRIRIPYVFQLKWSPNNEQDIYVTDTKTVSLENRLRWFFEFNARPHPTAMAQKICLALSQDRLFIDGQSFLMEGEPSETSFGATNLYQVKANLVEENYVFDSNSGLVEDGVLSGVIIGLDTTGQGNLLDVG